jgi:hypothetical protein
MEYFAMDDACKEMIWGQFGAAIDALEAAINACPEELWRDQSRYLQFWYMVSHTLFWLDYYLSEDHDTFKPPEPFGMEEMDPAGAMPPRIYTKAELLKYLEHCRDKCRRTIADMNERRAAKQYKFRKGPLTHAELLLYNMRHVQHHTAQLNLILRQQTDSAPGWTFTSSIPLFDE